MGIGLARRRAPSRRASTTAGTRAGPGRCGDATRPEAPKSRSPSRSSLRRTGTCVPPAGHHPHPRPPGPGLRTRQPIPEPNPGAHPRADAGPPPSAPVSHLGSPFIPAEARASRPSDPDPGPLGVPAAHRWRSPPASAPNRDPLRPQPCQRTFLLNVDNVTMPA